MLKSLLGSVLLVLALAGCTLFVPPQAWERGQPDAPVVSPGRDG